jgi:hypothetical protein
VLGEVYPGYAGVKGLYIEAVGFEGEYEPGIRINVVRACDFAA